MRTNINPPLHAQNQQITIRPGEHIPLPPKEKISKIEDALNACDAQLNELFVAVEVIESRLAPIRSIQPIPCAEKIPAKDKPTNVSERICDVAVAIGEIRSKIRNLIAELDI